MLDGHLNYRTFLKSKLSERVTDNPSYSLRSMAKQIGLAPSLLCEVMKGSRTLTSQSASKIASHFKFKDQEAEYFHLLVQFENERSEELKATILTRLQTLKPREQIRDLSIDAFKSIADWFHLPIIEMTQLKGFGFNPSSVAAALGISVIEAEVAMERLERLELIEKDIKGKYRKVSPRFITKSSISNDAFKRFNKSFLEKAIESLDTQTPQERLSGSETFAFSKSKLKEANQITEEYFNRMVALADESKDADEIYHLAVHLFQISKVKKKGKIK